MYQLKYMGLSYTPYTFSAAYKCYFTRPDVSPEKYVMMLGQSTLARNPAQKGTDSYVRLLIIPRGSSQTLYKKTAVRPRGRLN